MNHQAFCIEINIQTALVKALINIQLAIFDLLQNHIIY